MLQKIITLLYISGDALTVKDLAQLLETTEAEIQKEIPHITEALSTIGLHLLQSNEGLAIVTQGENAPLVEKFWKKELEGDLTAATLQVLTLVCYLGNPTREEISYIRGVQSAQSIRTLTVRGLISRQGEVCTLSGQALEYLGITEVHQLPDYEAIRKSLVEKLEMRNV